MVVILFIFFSGVNTLTPPQMLLVDAYNFPLNRERAEQLGINTTELSREMGRMLAQLHMAAINEACGIQGRS